jgi:hypothetical protein
MPLVIGPLVPLLNCSAMRRTFREDPKSPIGDKGVATIELFMEPILLPMLMRSLMGEEAKDLREELPSFVRERVNFFLAAVSPLREVQNHSLQRVSSTTSDYGFAAGHNPI